METTWINHLAAYQAAMQQQVPHVFRGLMDFMLRFRMRLLAHYPSGYAVSHLSPGYLDFSYFAFTPETVRQQKLKVAVVFNHQELRFEIWLCGQNKGVQKEFWTIFKESDWDKANLAPTPQRSVLEEILVVVPDFSNEDELFKSLEAGIMRFNDMLIEALA
ncbi:MAG: hypothetical protein AAFZ63_15265 [Bacteroidota bacterium]